MPVYNDLSSYLQPKKAGILHGHKKPQALHGFAAFFRAMPRKLEPWSP